MYHLTYTCIFKTFFWRFIEVKGTMVNTNLTKEKKKMKKIQANKKFLISLHYSFINFSFDSLSAGTNFVMSLSTVIVFFSI